MSDVPPPKREVPIFNTLNYFGTSIADAIGANKTDFPEAQGQQRFPFGITFGPDDAGETYEQTSAYSGAAQFGSAGGTTYQDCTLTIDDNGQITNIASGAGVVQYDLAVEDNGTTVNTNPLTMNFVPSTDGQMSVVQDPDPTQVNINVPQCANVTDGTTTVPNAVNIQFAGNTTVTQDPSNTNGAIVTTEGVAVQLNGATVTTNTQQINFTGNDVTVAADASGNAVVNILSNASSGFVKGIGSLYNFSFSQTYTQNAGTVNYLTNQVLTPPSVSSPNLWDVIGAYPFSLYFDSADWSHSTLVNNYNNTVVLKVDINAVMSQAPNASTVPQQSGSFTTSGYWYCNPYWQFGTTGVGQSVTATGTNVTTAPTNYNYPAIAACKDGNSGGAVGWNISVLWNNSTNPLNTYQNGDYIWYFNPSFTAQGGIIGSSQGRYGCSTYVGTQYPSGAAGPPEYVSVVPFCFPGSQLAIDGSLTRTTQMSVNVTVMSCPTPITILAPNLNALQNKISAVST